jgi:hypothetical protein
MATETFLRFGALYRQENTFLAGPFRAGQEWGPCACIRAGSRGRCRIAGPTPGERWSSPLVATASENGLSFRRNPQPVPFVVAGHNAEFNAVCHVALGWACLRPEMILRRIK